MTLLSDFAQNAANAPSTIASTDRAIAVDLEWDTTTTTRSSPSSAAADAAASSSEALPPLPFLLATSPPSPIGSVQSLQARLLAARKKNELLEEIERGVDSDGYPLCQYRKGFLDHFKARSLITSTLRVSLTQATTIMVSFISEQLELDLKRNVKVSEGELTQLQADFEAEDWEKIEWDRRWKTFPKKFLTALAKYHAVTLIMRTYEFIASKIVNLKQLNKLTTDPFAMSKRMATKLEEQHKLPGNNNNEMLSVTISMTQTTLWANLIPFCADYSLHQGLLCYGYYKYHSFQRQKRLLANADVSSPADVDEHDSAESAQSETASQERRALASDLVTKSSRLVANRGLGWVCSAAGAGIGSVLWPGWGTIVVSSLGDAVVGSILDDGYHRARTSLEEQQRDEETKDAIHKAQIQ